MKYPSDQTLLGIDDIPKLLKDIEGAIDSYETSITNFDKASGIWKIERDRKPTNCYRDSLPLYGNRDYLRNLHNSITMSKPQTVWLSEVDARIIYSPDQTDWFEYFGVKYVVT